MPSEFKPDIDPALEAFLLKALAKDPADRFADAQEMLAEIQIFQGTESTTMTRLSNPSQTTQISAPPNQKSGKNNKWFILAGTLIGVVVIALLAMVLLNQQPVEEIAVVTPAVTPTNAAVLVIATETAVPEPTSIPAILEAETITAVPTLEPTAEPVETPPPVDIAQQSFSVDAIDFSGPAGQPANTFSLSLARIQLPDTGTEHVVWLIKDGTPQRLGTLPVGSPPDLSAAIEGSDVTEFERFVISMEPIGNSAEITGTIVYEKTLSDEFLAPLTTLLNENLVNANTQLAIAQDHTGFLQNELANGNLENALVHAEHVVNILDGANGTDYGDLNGDGMAQNPGDDIGVRAYLESATASAAQALEAAALSGFAQSSAEKMVRALENSSANQKKAQALALKLFALDSVAEIQPFADELEILLQQVQAGSDNDGNGVVDALAGEGGLTAVYDNGLSWLAHSYVAENGTNSAENSPAGTLFFAPDGLTLTLNDVLLPPVGTAYHAWLLNETTSEITPLGPLSVINNHIRATFPVTQPVTTPNSQLLITLENETEADAPTETAVYSGSLPPETNVVLTGLLTPETGLLANLTVQTGLAIDHIGFMSEALAVGNLEDGKRHAEHVINILVGESSPEFGDLDNNGRAENPGNGVGVRIYLQQAAEQLALINLDSAERQFYAALTTAALDNSQIVIDDLLNKAGKIIAADSAAEASITMAEMMPLADVLRSGLDKDENGVMDPLMGESGIQSLPDLLTAVGHWAITPQ